MLTTARETNKKTANERGQMKGDPRNKAHCILKKVSIALIVLAIAFGLIACSNEAGDTNDTQQTNGTTDWDSVIATNPDDPYVQSYESGDASQLMAVHKQVGYTCEDCHDGSAAAMVGTVTTIPDSAESSVGTREMCLGCHDFDSIKDSTILPGDVTVYNTEGLYNVHDNHRGDEDCGQCHSMHETSTLNCVYCHYMEVPDGWDGFR